MTMKRTVAYRQFHIMQHGILLHQQGGVYAGQPHTIVAAMPHEKARFLEQDLILSKLAMTIELDRPLSLFDDEKGD